METGQDCTNIFPSSYLFFLSILQITRKVSLLDVNLEYLDCPLVSRTKTTQVYTKSDKCLKMKY